MLPLATILENVASTSGFSNSFCNRSNTGPIISIFSSLRAATSVAVMREVSPPASIRNISAWNTDLMRSRTSTMLPCRWLRSIGTLYSGWIAFCWPTTSTYVMPPGRQSISRWRIEDGTCNAGLVFESTALEKRNCMCWSCLMSPNPSMPGLCPYTSPAIWCHLGAMTGNSSNPLSRSTLFSPSS